MKLVLLIGAGAVGKMTVGQALAQRTGMRLFHNHMLIEPVLQVFGSFRGDVIASLREIVFDKFSSDASQKGMIFTYMWAFDQQQDGEYIRHVA